METESKQIIEKKVYEDGRRNYATQGEALGIGIPALVLGGAAAASLLFGRGRGLNGGMPENINIATGGNGGSGPDRQPLLHSGHGPRSVRMSSSSPMRCGG